MILTPIDAVDAYLVHIVKDFREKNEKGLVSTFIVAVFSNNLIVNALRLVFTVLLVVCDNCCDIITIVI